MESPGTRSKTKEEDATEGTLFHNGRRLTKNQVRSLARRKGESGMLNLLRVYTRNAERAGRKFELTIDEFRRLTSGHCAYCGVEPSHVMRTHSDVPIIQEHTQYVYNGIDRMNNSRGYSVLNCLSCCGTCNRAKGARDFSEWAAWLRRVAEYQSRE